uniref:Receptor ligand binding region domain-containing protein n=1 Tax=Romanomermis culicivorax TaxID=13658 RepID=A0A915L6W3_ROMCU
MFYNRKIVLTCIDKDEDNRRFTLRAQQRGLAGEEFVYIVPDYVRDENKTDVWTDRKGLVDGRDSESRKSMENVMFVEMQLESDAKLWKFKSEVVRRTKQAPFNYNSDLANDQFASLYAPFLHDAVYLYGIALNHTLSEGYNMTDGRAVTNYTRNVRFHGMSGHVVIDNVAGREPSFVLKGFGKDGKLTSFLVADMYKHEGS